MKKSDLQFEFPEDLIAQEPLRPSRICLSLKSESSSNEVAKELAWSEFIELFQPGDCLVLNNTKVLKRRVFTSAGVEILFLQSNDLVNWDVLFLSKKFKVGSEIELPGGVVMTLLEKGRPQKVKSSQVMTSEYFERFGELPLPPYIQKAREKRSGERRARSMDDSWYQTAWSERPGSFAAPTASLHFTQEHLAILKKRGVNISYLTLHVGLGTFLPVESENLAEHPMHYEDVEIPVTLIEQIKLAQSQGKTVWAIGTTVLRALEAYAKGHFQMVNQSYLGRTNLLILPGFDFKVVDGLLTNFHQPESTLLALVMAFAGQEKVKEVYRWAIENKFRLFSYGDLSVWRREK